MAYIKTIKENELVNGSDNTDVYPVSTTQAIFSQNSDGTVPSGIQHQRLEDRLQDHEADAKELHRKVEKLVAYIESDKDNQVLEITGMTTYYINAAGTLKSESYGDEPSETIQSYTKRLEFWIDDTLWSQTSNPTATFEVPNVVGHCKVIFTATYNGITKTAISHTYINLRKYFGFSSSQPTTSEDITSLGTSDFSNTVNCTVTLNAKPLGAQFKYIYFAVPNGMTINNVTQPDALNAPLPITLIGTLNREINGVNYLYKLYRSVDTIDSTASKRLTIS